MNHIQHNHTKHAPLSSATTSPLLLSLFFSLSLLLSLEHCLWMSSLSSDRKHTYLYIHTPPPVLLSLLCMYSDVYIGKHEHSYTLLHLKPCASAFSPQTLMTLSFWEIIIVAPHLLWKLIITTSSISMLLYELFPQIPASPSTNHPSHSLPCWIYVLK